MATQRVAKANRNESWCPIEQTLGVIGGIWKVIIIRELLTGTKRYGQLHRSVGLSAPDSRASRFAHWLVWEIPDDRTLMARANRR
ncbi:MAG TPA: winged helix-turn-helix transcriptional regulator [Gemmatimonadaceae bacterium]|nr:winged helix-turn-helix transcriptional regulator [Gemmatimonadaceae bacterium]